MTKSRLYFQRKLREVLEIENHPPLPGDIPEIHNNIVGKGLEDFLKRYSGFRFDQKKLTLSYHAI